MQNQCLSCMNDKGELDLCPFCGWDGTEDPNPTMYLKRGTILNGKYIVGMDLGHGGFGITYLAWDIILQVKIVIKEYFQSGLVARGQENMVTVFSGNKAEFFDYGKSKFLEEARTLAKLDSIEGIVGVKDYFEENNTAYFVMRYLDGITLKDHIAHMGGKLPWETAVQIMMPVLDGLREVHREGVLHRDISPDNIFITSSGQVKILDFGAARYAIGKKSENLSVILKPGYAPEEQYKSKGNQGPWTDVYAASACLYHAITGEVPPEALERFEEDTLTAPVDYNPTIPDHVESALLKGLAVRAKDRFQTIEEFQKILLTGEPLPPQQPVDEDPKDPGSGTDHNGTDDTKKKTGEKGSGKKALLTVAGLLALIILVALAVYLYSGRTGSLTLTLDPEDAVVDIPGYGRFKQGMKLKPGQYTVSIRKDGYKDRSIDVSISAGIETEETVSLEKNPGILIVETVPDNAVIRFPEDGYIYFSGMELYAGRYDVEVTAPGFQTLVKTIEIKPGETTRETIELERLSRITNSLGMEFVYIEPGEFTMGSRNGEDDERPTHRVRLNRGFYMQTTEVTVKQYVAFVSETQSHVPQWAEKGSLYHIETGSNDHYKKLGSALQGNNYPIVGVSWNDATAFAQWLSRKETERTGQAVEYRLPTEAEWEYACRAGSDSDYANEKALAELGWYNENSGGTTHKVGELSPNAWGLYDMHGNVWEWCQDWYGDYPSGTVTDPDGPSTDSNRILRGGGWETAASRCRSSLRGVNLPDNRSNFNGFRFALSPVQ